MYLCLKFFINPVALRKAKIVYNFGFSECSGLNMLYIYQSRIALLNLGSLFAKVRIFNFQVGMELPVY